ncbi:MAG: alginate O-acetyltransferase AlgF [Spirochaetes bacterium]|nr:alginate O-acetyltransferase AlgF [Spirochaetota bacterium]MBU1082068.1 alginate O-acetyltransferase AlgF [Spirochaetota bacterium]
MRPSIRTIKVAIALAIGICTLAAAPASPQARSIYGGGVAEDAVLVRLVDAGAPAPVELGVGALALAVAAPGDATPYRPTVADVYMLRYAGRRYEFMPEPGRYYTIVASAGGLHFFSDEKHLDRARAQLYFYNALSAPARLATADGSATIVGPCPGGSSGQVAVNPVRATVAAFGDGGRLGDPIELRLERGASYSVFVYSGAAGPRAFSVEAAVATE